MQIRRNIVNQEDLYHPTWVPAQTVNKNQYFLTSSIVSSYSQLIVGVFLSGPCCKIDPYKKEANQECITKLTDQVTTK